MASVDKQMNEGIGNDGRDRFVEYLDARDDCLDTLAGKGERVVGQV